MNVEEVANAMRARKHGSYWMARCVVHDDRSPSVSIRQEKNGVSIRCFAGCDTKDILAMLGLTFRDLGWNGSQDWKQRIQTKAARPAGNKKPLGRLEATYRYTDKHGELVAEKLRYEGKIFLWRKPKLAGGWEWKVDRENLPIYLLHEVVLAHTVFLVEGEKDADNLRKAIPFGKREGLAFTTAPNGAKSWRTDYTQWFRDRKVWIIPDTDVPGMKYARRAAGDIAKVAQWVRIVSVSPAKDVSDFLLLHTVAELSTRLREAAIQ